MHKYIMLPNKVIVLLLSDTLMRYLAHSVDIKLSKYIHVTKLAVELGVCIIAAPIPLM